MTLHMVDVVGQYKKIKNEIDDAIRKVTESGQFILGREVGEFECQIAGYLGVNYAVGCASGTDALQLALMGLGIEAGDEVITTPFTFVATTETIALLGAKPVYVDIDPLTFNIDASQIEQAITPRTKAIMPVHLYGQPADMDPIVKVARAHALSIIEDSAQALGASYKGKKVCTFGDVACISYFPSKNLGAFGDAGMVVCNDKELWERMKMIAVHGSRQRYHHEVLGVNSRLDTLQAAILLAKLPYLEQWNSARQHAAALYDELLAGIPVTVPHVAPIAQHIFHQYTIRSLRRNALAEFLKAREIPHAVYYPIPLHLQKAYAGSGYKRGDFPVTEQAADEVLSLPMHTELTEDQQRFITQAIGEFHTRS